MPILPQSPEGFTLIELLMVLMIMALGTVLLVGNLASNDKRAAGMQLEQLSASLDAARLRAIESNQTVAVPLEDGLTLQPATGTQPVPAFFPDGSSNGGTITLPNGRAIAVRWLDGAVRNVR